MVTQILHKPEYSAEATLAAFDQVVAELQENGVSAEELAAVQVKFRSDYITALEAGMGGYLPRFGLMHYAACFTLFDNDPSLVNTILDGFLAVTPEQVRAAAQRYLQPGQRAIVLRQPVGRAASQPAAAGGA
jgi:predicted Zn-dependent peptidase